MISDVRVVVFLLIPGETSHKNKSNWGKKNNVKRSSCSWICVCMQEVWDGLLRQAGIGRGGGARWGGGGGTASLKVASHALPNYHTSFSGLSTL